MKISKLVTSTLFIVYAICIMIVLLTGADIYKGIHDRGTAAYNNRINNQYIVNHIRQSEDVSIEDFGDSQALVLHDHNEGYVTKIYYYDGFIMELFTPEDSNMTPSAGTKIAQADSFKIEQTDNLLKVTGIDDEGLLINVR
ncbi:MAG: DUF4860 domain-containing protein [Lachnospiraceae bacterium]|nr:DUF4860 domain-containing protein [Lachnospiraceae bacterium]